MTDDLFEPERVRGELSRLTGEPAREWHRREDLEHPGLEDAGVLIPVSSGNEEIELVFTHRSRDLDRHSGEVSFPGGRVDPDDDTLVDTALREAHEEIDLHPTDVRLFGSLTELPTVTGFRIQAFVGEFPRNYELAPCRNEIQSIFRTPLRELADPGIHQIEKREFQGEVYPVHFFDCDSHTIWGATGWLLFSLLEYLKLVDRKRRGLD